MGEIEKNSRENVLKILIVNKCDFKHERDIQFEEGQVFANRNGIKFIETSDKNNTNINEAFEALAKLMVQFSHENKFLKNETKVLKSVKGKVIKTKKKCS